MKLFYKYLVVVFLLVAAQWPAGALQAQKTIPTDSSQVQLRSIPAASMEKYHGDNDFNYLRQRPQGMSWWDRFWYWLFTHVLNAGAISDTWWSILKVLFWIICIAGVIYAVIRLAGMQGAGLFASNKKAEDLDYTITEDDIYAINFAEAIAKAVAEKNYRLAIRLLYLQTLRRMADRELIRWKPEKTNDVYAQELYGSNYYKDFASLTYTYDYAWYGDFSVREDQFILVQQHFQTFQRQLPG